MPTARANRPRRKAKQQRAHETVNTILEAAARVLAVHGYAASTTNRIAQTAGVSVGTLYEYFADKEGVFDALIRRELDALVEALRGQDLSSEAPVAETIGGILLAGMVAMPHGPELFRSLEQVPGATFRRHLAEARLVVIGFVKKLLEEHRSELRVADLDLAAFVVVSAAEGVAGSAPRDLFDERLAGEVTTLLTAYLTGR